MPEVVTTIREMRAACDDARRRGSVVGVVPTMGYLHEGHRALMRAARRECGFVVVTIFVNPLQFGPTEDLDRYPRDLDGDLAATAAEGADVVFAPPTSELYPQYPPATTVHVAGLTDALCGASRPGHFDGVTTVVTKLLAIAGPSRAYFGRKDAQQIAVITRLVADLDLPVTVVGCPLVREPDGLARSSRNAYLDHEQRAAAAQIFAALRAGVDAVQAGERSARAVEALVRERIAREPLLRVDYVEARDAATISAIETIVGDVLLAVAVFCGSTRLIDNVGLHVQGADVDADLGIGWSPQHAYPVG
jgi:pantoate--beta-alanine ligase